MCFSARILQTSNCAYDLCANADMFHARGSVHTRHPKHTCEHSSLQKRDKEQRCPRVLDRGGWREARAVFPVLKLVQCFSVQILDVSCGESVATQRTWRWRAQRAHNTRTHAHAHMRPHTEKGPSPRGAAASANARGVVDHGGSVGANESLGVDFASFASSLEKYLCFLCWVLRKVRRKYWRGSTNMGVV